MIKNKNKCWFFHNWKKSYENYTISVPEHLVPIGAFIIKEPQCTHQIEFLIRTCSSCGKRQKKRMLSEGWDNWKHLPKQNQIINAKIINQINLPLNDPSIPNHRKSPTGK